VADSPYKTGVKQGIISIVINTALFIFKFWAGIVSGSLAIVADAWHTLSDSLSSVVMLYGLKVSNKPADEKHQFGHGRAELIAAMVIGIMLATIGVEILAESSSNIWDKKLANYNAIAITAVITSIIVKELMAQYTFAAARKTKLQSLNADAWHHRTDSISSVIVLVGIFIGSKLWFMDSILAIIIAAFIFYAAYKIVRKSASDLLGESPSRELIKDVERISKKIFDKETNPHHFHIHNYINQKELTFHIRVPARMTAKRSHAIAKAIENRIRKKHNIEATIHVDPR